MNFAYLGQTPRFYPDNVTPSNGSLIALPGDVLTRDLFGEVVPRDGLWQPTDAPATEYGPRSWPVKATPAEPVSEPTPDAELAAGTDLSAGFPATQTDEVPNQES